VLFRSAWPHLTPNVRRVLALAVPGAIAASGMQINILISQALAGLEQGARSWLQFADRLYQLPLGLVGVAVGVAILPRLSRSARSADGQGAQKLMDDGVGLAMALTLPAAGALMVAPAYLIEGLFARGAFTAQDAQLAGRALFHFAWGVPAFVLIKVLAPGFFAREDTSTPMRYALVSVLVNTVLGAGLFFWLRAQGQPGFPGLAMATSLAAWINAGALAATLRARGWYRPGALLASRLAAALLSSLAMAFTLVILLGRYRGWLDGLAPGRFLQTLAFIVIGMGIYALFAFWFGAVRPGDIKALARRPTAE
jgi:putative peptidoglycan lipid II flippase